MGGEGRRKKWRKGAKRLDGCKGVKGMMEERQRGRCKRKSSGWDVRGESGGRGHKVRQTEENHFLLMVLLTSVLRHPHIYVC